MFTEALTAGSVIVCCLAACLAPQLVFIGVNITDFTDRQIRNSILFLLAVGLLIGGAAAVGGVLLRSVEFHLPFFGSLPQMLGCAAASALLLVFGERSLTEGFPDVKKRLAVRAALVAAMFGATLLASCALPAALLLIACGFGWHDIRKNRRKNRSPILLDSAPEENIRHPEKLRGQIRFRMRPNIYLFYLESMHSSKAVRALYGIDGTDIDRFLEKNGFTLYPDFLSTACWTAGTAFALFARHPLFDATIPEYPVVFRIFRENGYAVRLVDKAAQIFGRWAWLADYCSFSQGPARTWLLRTLLPVFTSCRWLRGLFGISDPFDITVRKEEDFSKIHRAVKSMLEGWNDPRPTFSVIRFGAEHTEFPNDWEDIWAEEYPPLYQQARNQLEIMTKLIMEHDPDAVIIAVGDHGARWHGLPWMGDMTNLPQAAEKRGIDPRRLVLDFFSVLLAIRWPSGPFPHQIHTHVNLFAAIFAELSGDPACLEARHGDISILMDCWRGRPGHWIAAERGHPLPVPRLVTREDMLEIFSADIRIDPYNIRYYYGWLDSLRADGRDPLAGRRLFEVAGILSEQFGDDRLLEILEKRGNSAVRKQPEALGCFAAELAARQKALSGRAEAARALPPGRHAAPAAEERLAWLHVMAGNVAEAEDVCRHILTKRPDDAAMSWLLCLLLSRRGEWEAACEIARRREDSRHLEAMLLVRHEQWKQALHLLQRKFDSKSYGVWDIALYAKCRTQLDKDIFKWLAALYNQDDGGMKRVISLQTGMYSYIYNMKDKSFLVHKNMYREDTQKCISIINSSGIFDKDYYGKTNGQDGIGHMSPVTHFLRYGMFSLKDPSHDFDIMLYLFLNHDVYMQVLNPVVHYIEFGKREGRACTLVPPPPPPAPPPPPPPPHTHTHTHTHTRSAARRTGMTLPNG